MILGMEDVGQLDLRNLESVHCNLCGCDDYEVMATLSRFHIPLRSVICRRCGLMYINPRMSQEQYKGFYKSVYRIFLPPEGGTEKIFEQEKTFATEMLDFCQPYFQRGQRVLDVGCGPGGHLAVLEAAGMEAEGLEPSLEESSFGRSRGLKVSATMLEDVVGSLGRAYDAVVLSRSLNHFADPSASLKKIWEILGPGGYLYLRLLDFPAQCRFGFIWECSQADHLYMFCPETVRAMLEKIGFNVVKTAAPAAAFKPWNLWAQPKFHMEILARKNELQRGQMDWPDYRHVRARVRRNQFWYRLRRLILTETYRHWVAQLIKRLLGQSVFSWLKNKMILVGLVKVGSRLPRLNILKTESHETRNKKAQL